MRRLLLVDVFQQDQTGILLEYDLTTSTLHANTNNFAGNEVMEVEAAPVLGSSPREIIIGADVTSTTTYPGFVYKHWFPGTGTFSAGNSIAGTTGSLDSFPMGRWSDFEPDCGDFDTTSNEAMFCGHLAIPGPPNNYWGSNETNFLWFAAP